MRCSNFNFWVPEVRLVFVYTGFSFTPNKYYCFVPRGTGMPRVVLVINPEGKRVTFKNFNTQIIEVQLTTENRNIINSRPTIGSYCNMSVPRTLF